MTTPGSRDIRPGAFEAKFVVGREIGNRIREAARMILSPDPHASGPARDQYQTTTLYFDTRELAVYQRRGSYSRAKYRIRRYGQGDAVFLERKLRTPDVLSKRRTGLVIGDLARLASGKLDSAWPGRWFHERLMMRGLSPACQVTYSRTARIGMSDCGPIRLTIDDDLGGMAIDAPVFDGGEPSTLLAGKTIVELKFTATMPGVFKHLVEEFALEPARVSKYRLGIEATRGIAPAETLHQIKGFQDLAHAVAAPPE